jgi:ribonucleotide monophosphatase NagD (HAD superfamily)
MSIYNLLKKIYRNGENIYFISNGLTRSERKLMREYDALFQTDGKTYVSLTIAGCDAARKL